MWESWHGDLGEDCSEMPATAAQCHQCKGSLVWGGLEPEEAHYPLKGPSCQPTSLIHLLGCQDKNPLILHAGCATLVSLQGMESSSPHGEQPRPPDVSNPQQIWHPHPAHMTPLPPGEGWCAALGQKSCLGLIPGPACPLLGEHLKHEGFLELLSTWMKPTSE